MRRPLHFFVPVYFDVASFSVLREKILRLLPAEFEPFFHVLDDSAGADPEAAKLEGVTLHRMPRNLGHQGALVKGLREHLARDPGDFLIVTLDGDGEDRPEDLPALLQELGKGDAIVLARRTSRTETALFKVCYFFYKLLFRALTGTLIRTGNYALYTSATARALLPHPYFDHSYASTLVALGSKLAFVPCPRGSRYHGQSKMSFPRLALHGLRMLLPFRRRIAARLLVALAALGLAFYFFVRKPVRILAIGESTTFLGGEQAWPRLLEAKLKKQCGARVTVATFAIPGSDSYDMAARIPAGLAIHDPKAVVSMLGINDYESTTVPIDDPTRALFARDYDSEAELAAAVLQEVLEKDPWRDRRYSFLFARYYRDRGLLEEGLAAHGAVLAKYPHHPWALSELGVLERARGNAARAAELHREAITARPAVLDFRLELLADLAQDPRAFEEEYRKALAAVKDARALDFFAAGLHQGRGDWAGQLRLMRKITGDGCRTRKCLLMLNLALERNGRKAEAEAPPAEPALPVTVRNYLSVQESVKQKGAAFFAMQYPLLGVAELSEAVGLGTEGVISNEEPFRSQVNKDSYAAYFTDRFAGDFGHFTPLSQEAVAENAARSLLPWLKRRLLCL